jgi:glycine/D-amino acid oxidase-like deaminating enzyme
VAPPFYDVLIAGGGVVGQSIAHFLSSHPEAAGMRIGVVERDPTHATSSTALSVGGIRQQFSTPENIRLSLFSAEFFRTAREHLAVEGEAPQLGFQEKGYLFLATERGRPVLERNVSVQTELGAQVEILDQGGLRARFPWLQAEDLSAGSLGLSGEGWLDPHSLLHAFRKKASSQGVSQIADEVVAVASSGHRIQTVSLAMSGTVSVGCLVNAAGPRAARVAEMAGVADLPVRPRKRMVYGVKAQVRLPACPLVIDPSGVYFRPEGEGFLCGVSPPAHQDPDTLDLTVDSGLFHDRVWPMLAKRVPAFDRLRLESSWAGHYAFNPLDQNAILGPHPEVENLIFANGFSGHGLQHSPGIGRAVAELLLFGEYRTLDLRRFSFSRFEENQLIKEVNVV